MIITTAPAFLKPFSSEWNDCLSTDELGAIVLYLVDSGIQPSGAYLDVDIESALDEATIRHIERLNADEKLAAAKKLVSTLIKRFQGVPDDIDPEYEAAMADRP